MSLLQKLQQYILPAQIDFFTQLKTQGQLIQQLVNQTCAFYQNEEQAIPTALDELFKQLEKNRHQALKDLNRTFITPVDKEAISRVYFQLNGITLKIKHLFLEMEVYKIYQLQQYESILALLQKEITLLEQAITNLQAKNYTAIHQQTDILIQNSNQFSKSYATLLNHLFHKENHPRIYQEQEILFQLKDIHHVIIATIYALEDIVFKLN